MYKKDLNHIISVRKKKESIGLFGLQLQNNFYVSSTFNKKKHDGDSPVYLQLLIDHFLNLVNVLQISHKHLNHSSNFCIQFLKINNSVAITMKVLPIFQDYDN